jgi:hypothetical protein
MDHETIPRRARRRAVAVLALALLVLAAAETALAEYVPPRPVAGGTVAPPSSGTGAPESGGVARQPVQASQLKLVGLGSYSALVSFRTSHAVLGRVAYGQRRPLYLASADAGPSLVHTVRVDGLLPGRRYELDVLSHEGPGNPVLVFQTKARPADVNANVTNGTLQLEDATVLPLMAFAPCPWNVPDLLAAGVNLFIHDYCDTSAGGRLNDSIAAVGRRGWNAVAWDRRSKVRSIHGLVGYSYDDEPDGRATPPSKVPTISAKDKVSVLTLTHHVVNRGLPWGTDAYYAAYINKADVVGFDYYPTQEICRANDFQAVYDLQRNLVAISGRKATFQWIEVAPMRCSRLSPGDAERLRVTPQTIRAEMLLAVAGGASGLGIFPSFWNDPSVVPAVRQTFDQLADLAAFLPGEQLSVQVSGENAGDVRVGVRRRADALMVIVVNADAEKSAKARLWGGDLAGRQLVALDGGPLPTVDAGGAVQLGLGPLEGRIFVSPARPLPFGL